MMAISPDMRNSVRTAMAAALVIWLSGLFFLVCCGQVNAETKPKVSCPMANMAGHCDKGHSRDSSSVDADDSTGRCVDCAYLPIVFNKYRKFESTTTELAQPTPRISVEFVPPAVKILPKQISAWHRISDEPQLLAKHCILRI